MEGKMEELQELLNKAWLIAYDLEKESVLTGDSTTEKAMYQASFKINNVVADLIKLNKKQGV